jgi:hypothetical protein
VSPQTCKRDGLHESYLSGAADAHRRPPPQTANQISWRKRSGRHRLVQRHILIGLQTIEHPARFRDSWQDRYRSTRLVIWARFNDGRFRVRTEAKLRPLARFGCSMVWRLISALIEASRVNETMRLLHFSTPDKSGPDDGYGCHAHAAE